MTISAAVPPPVTTVPDGDHESRFAAEAIPYMSRLYPAALRLTRNHCDAEDLIQETFAKAYVKFHQFSPGTNLKACGGYAPSPPRLPVPAGRGGEGTAGGREASGRPGGRGAAAPMAAESFLDVAA